MCECLRQCRYYKIDYKKTLHFLVEWVNSDDSNNKRCMRCANVPGASDDLSFSTNQGRCDTCLPDGSKCLTCLIGYLRSDEKGIKNLFNFLNKRMCS